ncbi:hypothetical protein [Amycolatopsis sp. SID8362]|uniref:hypothetical protein n=1 Tax=Amycolatopsis sp. SID8362 TaxID=2690346 RepID=UPI00136B45F7|nr:hypothetical protein [Amycolatopsis sp. SID8362]NBH02409.1 hypothetical protein [Amycolatopsis sp. SID8362]NED39113.1 hypothetical protein [Amycolatopsis sp. SID8362]
MITTTGKRVAGAVAASAVGLTLMAVSAGTASAADVTGSCSSKGSTANYSATYKTASGKDWITKVSWHLGGAKKVGNKNNVEARAKYDKTLGHDTIKHTWISADNAKPDGSKNLNGWDMARKEKSYVEFKFAIDVKGADPHCSGHTASF